MMKNYIAETKEGRNCAVLLPMFSLPSEEGIGNMGNAARLLIDFLSEAGFSAWQLLPLGPVGEWNSPYSALSAFAGNPQFIDLGELVRESLLDENEYLRFKEEAMLEKRLAQVDYTWLNPRRRQLLKQAFETFLKGNHSTRFNQAWLESFSQEQAEWLDDYVLFQSLREFHSFSPFQTWPEPYRLRDERALKDFSDKYEKTLMYQRFVQALFFEQWTRVKAYAAEKRIKLIGDLQIYLSAESCEAWREPDLFSLDDQSLPLEVGGCPPDDWGGGQYWGTPVYQWEQERADCFKLWERRLVHNQKLFDTIRIDHFRGLESFWSIPFQEKPALGRWKDAPGLEMLQSIMNKHPGLSLIAEDLGYKTAEVCAMRDQLKIPGMRVMQFGFDPWGNSENLPHNVPENCIYYFGTHDNPPINAWFRDAPMQDLRFAVRYLGLNQEEGYREGVLRALLSSAARTVILQFQDLIGTHEESRINVPGEDNAWRWRVPARYFAPTALEKLKATCRELLIRYGRSPATEPFKSER